MLFQSTLPARGATRVSCRFFPAPIFQSTLPARGATQIPLQFAACWKISIHAPRTGSDAGRAVRIGADGRISIHAPRTGSDRCIFGRNCEHIGFQSTLPARGATTRAPTTSSPQLEFQSTLPARGATMALDNQIARAFISIHAPRTGSDLLPHRVQEILDAISIHAPRTGSDMFLSFGQRPA